MRRFDFGALLLAITIASAGCGGEDDGGAGGTGGTTALSFDADTALPASAGAATAIAFAVQFGAVMGNVFAGLSGGSAQAGLAPKVNIPVPGFCSGGTAVLDWDDRDNNNLLEVGEIVILTLENCSGSPVASGAASGTIRLTIEEVGGGLPIIGGIIGATAELNLTIAGPPPTTITGTFRVDANIPLSLALVNLTFIALDESDTVAVTEDQESLSLECFNISQRAGLPGPGTEFFRAFGVARLGNQVYSLNDPAATPNIGFDFSSGSPVPTSGSIGLFSGNRAGEACSGGAPQGDNSSCTMTFNPGGCVDVECMGSDGAPFARSIFWSDLLDSDFSSASEELCSGGNGETTSAVRGPECAGPGDLMAIADAYIRGGTSATEDYQNTSYGTRSNLTIKSVADLRFSRKIYIVFDLSSAPETFDKASLVLTLIRHIRNEDNPELSGPQPVDVYGIVDDNLITDDNDWDPATLAEDAITWNNAPRNDTAAGNAFEDDPGVEKFISGYDFDLEDDEGMDDPGTKYALDITEYVRGRLTNDADADKKITVLMAIPTLINVEGSEFKSRDIPEGEICDRPFLHFE